MKRFLALLLLLPLRAPAAAADSARGAQLFETLSCIQCHSVNGHGGTAAPDLGRRVDRDFTPASLAATMWNHAPTMWAAMKQRQLEPGDLNPQAASDLMAFFYAARFFDKPGDAARGKALFAGKHCAECHGISSAKLPEAKPVAEWQAIGHPMALADAMWNHAATMKEEFARRKIAWPRLDAQDLTDMLVYLRNLPETRNGASRVEITAGAEGRELFEKKGCAGCHTGKLALPGMVQGRTLTEIAAAMWNHEPLMAASPPQLSVDEMREIVSYVWSEQFFRGSGNAHAGERVFAAKGCASCHRDPSGGAPRLTGGNFDAAAIISALWHHGPRMLAQMNSRSLAWPRFEGRQMSDLLAYLNSAREQH